MLRNVKEGDTFMTGAGLQIDEISEDEDNEKKDLYPFDDEPPQVDEVMQIIKRDVFKMRDVSKND